MAERTYDPEGMDKAAKEAEQDLGNLESGAVKAVAGWFAKWYLQAGHKRLGRVLVAISKEGGIVEQVGQGRYTYLLGK